MGATSAVDGDERLDDAVLVVEERLAELVLGPGDDLPVRVHLVAAGEDLVAVADRVEEVDGVTAGDAVAGRPDVDVDAVEPEDVRGPTDVGPAVQPEGEVVEATAGTAGERDVVGRAGALEEDDELVALVADELFGQPEAERLPHEVAGVGHVLGRQQAVVEA